MEDNCAGSRKRGVLRDVGVGFVLQVFSIFPLLFVLGPVLDWMLKGLGAHETLLFWIWVILLPAVNIYRRKFALAFGNIAAMVIFIAFVFAIGLGVSIGFF